MKDIQCYTQIDEHWNIETFGITLFHIFEIYELTCTVIEMQNSSVSCIQMCENASTTRVGRITSCSAVDAR